MTTPTRPVGRRLWFVSLVLIVAIVAVGIIVSRYPGSTDERPPAAR
jgi:hypothetical protein